MIDLERVPGGWRASGHRIDDAGRAADQLLVDLPGETWQEAADALHRQQPDDVPGRRGAWRELGADRVQWAHQRHHDRPGSPSNPHRLEIRMPSREPRVAHESVEAAPVRRRRWGWLVALLAGLLVGAGLAAALAWYYAGVHLVP